MKEVVVIFDNVRSVFNVGSVLRTADGSGVKKVYLCGITPTPNHPKIKKTALGAEDYVEWEHVNDISDLIIRLKLEDFSIIGVEQSDNSVNYKDISYSDKTAIIFGNEITGISKETMDMCDYIAEIPMRGKKNSLNVSTSAGIILYHII